MPRAASLPSITLPTPGTRFTGSGSRNASTRCGGITNWPSGLRQSEAILARNLFGAIPAEAVSWVSSRICVRMVRAISVASSMPLFGSVTAR
ncbi:hypothetical protein G6F66_014722 [Rhizopus arrhizus]|nr:hypothetical protein G6F66_014722 [Rhizopus arrhizus]